MKTLTRLIVITLSIVALAAWSAWAGDLTIPNTFVANTPAVADEVNANFSAVETEVDDNAADITTNAGNIATNTSDIATNAANITTNTSNITTNTSNITTNTSNIATNTSDIATNAAAINDKQDRVTGTCPADSSIRAIAADGTVTCETDNDSGGDITAVNAGTGLSGGGTSGDVGLSIATGGVGSSEIADGSIMNIDINAAAAIAASKIWGDVGIDYIIPSDSGVNDTVMKNLGSMTVSVPSSGYVLVLHSGGVMYDGEGKRIFIGIGTSPTEFSKYISLGDLDGTRTRRYYLSYNTMAIFNTSAGTKTYYALAQGESVFDLHNATILPEYLVAIFIPKRY